MEVLKLDWELGPPQVADLNQDGYNDLVVVNNRQARIELLLQRPDFDPEALAVVEPSENVNDILGKEQQWRFCAGLLSGQCGRRVGQGRGSQWGSTR